MENRKGKRRRRRRRKQYQLNAVVFFVLFIFIFAGVRGLRGITTRSQEGSSAACGIEGHFNGDGLNHKKLKVDCGNGHMYACTCDSWMVPEGGTYYAGVKSSYLGDYSGASDVFFGGHSFPCGSRPDLGDIFVFGDYEYRYAYRYSNGWVPQADQRGWGVRVLDFGKSSFGELLNSIYTADVTHLCDTFADCVSLVSSPTLPIGAIEMTGCFSGCSSLETAPLIPQGVTSVANTFQNCVSLTSSPIFPQSVVNMSGTFQGCCAIVSVPELPGCVLNMDSTFSGCSALTVTPEIPATVTVLTRTFANCKRLVTPPSLPMDIENLDGTFSGCTLLADAPVIPKYVVSMNGTFKDCHSLIKAPNIPEDVFDMTSTFEGCISMKGYIVIFSNPIYYNRCLANTKIDEILGTTSLKEKFLKTR